MTKIMPSLREKKRYLVCEVVGNASGYHAVSALQAKFAGVFGVSEAAKAGIAGLKSSGSKCLVRVDRRYVDKLRASLALVKNMENERVAMRSIGVSGSIRKAALYMG